MTTRNQSRALCPACFAQQALRGDRLVQHGYTRPQQWHSNVGTCSGTNHPHFGTDAGRAYTAALAVQLRTQADGLDVTAGQVSAGTAPVWGRKRVSARIYTPVVLDAPTDLQRADYARRLAASAGQLRMAAADFDARVAAWTPQAPVTVTVAPSVTLWHWRTPRRWQGSGKACAGSYTGAHRGATTATLADVTCPKCQALAAQLAAAAAVPQA